MPLLARKQGPPVSLNLTTLNPSSFGMCHMHTIIFLREYMHVSAQMSIDVVISRDYVICIHKYFIGDDGPWNWVVGNENRFLYATGVPGEDKATTGLLKLGRVTLVASGIDRPLASLSLDLTVGIK
ncbi:hypothetical protein QAD02_011156 [Eretmocerus hayati]|uniref:Uncharacterized protein n=1 Tax=Eretmocerus hayati TaxID=131215 RepID=A0ACC2NVQ9_9HYME|nr:hypothetical protein QAD02_011156 [Eretmocerus hayati]